MYVSQRNWLERGPRNYRGVGQWIERGPTRYRGMGQVYPGSSCYDNSHDAGEIHCASASSVMLSAFNPFSQGETTTCSAQEQSCIQATPSAAGAMAPGVTTDACTPTLGFSCATAALLALAGLMGIAFFSTMAGRR